MLVFDRRIDSSPSNILVAFLFLNGIYGVMYGFIIVLVIQTTTHRVEIRISNENIEVFDKNELEFRVSWKNVERIEFFKEKYEVWAISIFMNKLFHRYKEKEGYRINFVTPDYTKPLKLHEYGIHANQTNIFKTALQNISHFLEINYVELSKEPKDPRDYEEMVSDLDKAIQLNKKN